MVFSDDSSSLCSSYTVGYDFCFINRTTTAFVRLFYFKILGELRHFFICIKVRNKFMKTKLFSLLKTGIICINSNKIRIIFEITSLGLLLKLNVLFCSLNFIHFTFSIDIVRTI